MNATEAFWSGEFGTEYHARDVREVPANSRLFSRMLRNAGPIWSAVEFGAGTGTNLEAVKRVRNVRTVGVEINPTAAAQIDADEVICGSLLTAKPPVCELSFTKGVLIHVAPEDLPQAYAALYNSSRKYVLVCEYFNPVPVEVEYRGHSGKLWKRDFAGEMMDLYPLTLVDYGFYYDRDLEMPSDNMNWFLLKK